MDSRSIPFNNSLKFLYFKQFKWFFNKTFYCLWCHHLFSILLLSQKFFFSIFGKNGKNWGNLIKVFSYFFSFQKDFLWPFLFFKCLITNFILKTNVVLPYSIKIKKKLNWSIFGQLVLPYYPIFSKIYDHFYKFRPFKNKKIIFNKNTILNVSTLKKRKLCI